MGITSTWGTGLVNKKVAREARLSLFIAAIYVLKGQASYRKKLSFYIV